MNRINSILICGAALAVVSSLASAQEYAAPFTSATRYNKAGQVTGTIAPDPDGSDGPLRYAATRNTYGQEGTATAGLLVKMEVGQLAAWPGNQEPAAWGGFEVFQTRTFGYDDQGRKVIERVYGDDDVTVESLVQFNYDGWDRVVCKAVRMSLIPGENVCEPVPAGANDPDRISRYGYDNLDQVVTEERGVGTSLAQTYMSLGYRGRGRISSYTDANGNRTELRYDSNGRLNKRVFPNLAFPGTVNENDFIRYTNDKNGNVEVERKRNNTTITNAYDNNNRLIFKDLSDNTHSGDIAYDYDLRGLTLAACFGANALDDDCVNSGEGETNDFDGFGNLKSRVSRMSGTARTLSYQYDLEGNRTRITHPGGVYFTYRRDGLNRVCTMAESASLSACDASESPAYLSIKYAKEGGRARVLRSGGAVTSYDPDNALRLESFSLAFAASSSNNLTNVFSYNPANQITALTQSNLTYNYTEAQNRVGSYGVNSLNQYTSIDGLPVTHDANGNLIADGAGMTYTYDMENHLVATGGAKSSTLRYDVLGRLARISVNGITTDFHYDGDALVGEYVGAAQKRRYVHGGQVDEPLVQYNLDTGAKLYLFADHQGSIIAHTTNAGSVAQTNSYDPYGIPGSANSGRFGYTGQAWLKELGLNYYKARIYAPKLGRFLQTDPIFYKDDMNLYAYVGQDPLNRNDPTGLQGVVCPEGIGDDGQSNENAQLCIDMQNAVAQGVQQLMAGVNERLAADIDELTDLLDQQFGPAHIDEKGNLLEPGAKGPMDEDPRYQREGSEPLHLNATQKQRDDRATYAENQRKEFERRSIGARAAGDLEGARQNLSVACVWLNVYYEAQKQAVPSGNICSK